MERSQFLKKSFGFLGMALVAPSLLARKEDTASCTPTVTETAGPFPTINPATLSQSNIVSDRTGVAFTININVKNISSCSPVSGIVVDIWHCDKDGNYSQYGGTQMQPTDYTAKNFLRGRQITDANGKVSYTSIFPGWYTGRATHIHVHMYTTSGTSLLITQIAFPEGSGSAVETVNAASSYGYTKGMSGYTYNASDNVFSDGTSTEMSTLTGSVAAGYTLDWDTYINATSTGLNEDKEESLFGLRQNFPNPAQNNTRVPVVLKSAASVKIMLLDVNGKQLQVQAFGTLPVGEHILDLDLRGIDAGMYIYRVKVMTPEGSFEKSQLLIRE